MRTSVNVTGDTVVATVVAQSEGQLNPPEGEVALAGS